jgi:N-hydroxyarylamine O-acetyltransferase
MQIEPYLERIGYDGPVRADLETLEGMHRAHWRTIPFENLNIQRGVPIVLDTERNYEKIVGRGRGGFCLELTGLFAWALREIGFEVDILGARVLSPDGVLSEPLSHMALLVHLDQPWLADVGFGGTLSRPLQLNERGLQTDGPRGYRIANDGDHWLVTSLGNTTRSGANQQYLMTLQPREYGDFTAVCHWLQTSPDSLFTSGDLVTLASDEGRATYSDGRLIVTKAEDRTETPVPEHDLPGILREYFGIELE